LGVLQCRPKSCYRISPSWVSAAFYAVVGIALSALTGSLAAGLMSLLALVPVILVVLLL
jgi:hypothetical protein